MVKKLGDLFHDTRRQLMVKEDQETATLMTRNLLTHVTGKSQSQILADREMYVDDTVCSAVDGMVARLLQDEPLAYVLGEWDFYGMRLQVDPNVLTPRDDTCAVTALAVYGRKRHSTG